MQIIILLRALQLLGLNIGKNAIQRIESGKHFVTNILRYSSRKFVGKPLKMIDKRGEKFYLYYV